MLGWAIVAPDAPTNINAGLSAVPWLVGLTLATLPGCCSVPAFCGPQPVPRAVQDLALPPVAQRDRATQRSSTRPQELGSTVDTSFFSS